jgi:acylphosphatase
MQRISLQIKGKVQGVFYRKSAAEKANEIGLTGFVKNLPDSSVYAEAQGTPEQLDAFEIWCRRGPQRAAVNSVETTPLALLEGENSFSVRH